MLKLIKIAKIKPLILAKLKLYPGKLPPKNENTFNDYKDEGELITKDDDADSDIVDEEQ